MPTLKRPLPVLIIGNGPVGLLLAYGLVKQDGECPWVLSLLHDQELVGPQSKQEAGSIGSETSDHTASSWRGYEPRSTLGLCSLLLTTTVRPGRIVGLVDARCSLSVRHPASGSAGRSSLPRDSRWSAL